MEALNHRLDAAAEAYAKVEEIVNRLKDATSKYYRPALALFDAEEKAILALTALSQGPCAAMIDDVLSVLGEVAAAYAPGTVLMAAQSELVPWDRIEDQITTEFNDELEQMKADAAEYRLEAHRERTIHDGRD